MQTESNTGGGGVTTFEVNGQKFTYNPDVAKAQDAFQKQQETELEKDKGFVTLRARIFDKIAKRVHFHSPKEIEQQG